MATVMKTRPTPEMEAPQRRPSVQRRPLSKPAVEPTTDEAQLRRDRQVALIVLAIVLAVMAAVIWLASMGGTPAPEGIEMLPYM